MDRVSNSSSATYATVPAFTLVEVILALGVLAVTVLTVLALQRGIGRSAAEISEQERAAQLTDAIVVELTRLRDRPMAAGQMGGLDALAAIIPAGNSTPPLKLVAARDGLRVISENDADNPVTGIWPRDRYYLVEVRRQPSPLGYGPGAGYLAIRLTVKWPYQIATGVGSADAMPADLAQASVVGFNTALTP